ncbi:MAG: S8 family serine peptidase [Candidatus Eisenbacteria bacterium]
MMFVDRIRRRDRIVLPLARFLLASLFSFGACALSPAAAAPYWVFFRDRGPAPAPTLEIARALPQEVWARRARAAGESSVLPNRHDLPPWQPYVDQVARFGRLRHCSRWLNAVSADLDDDPDLLAALRALPCVREIRPVAVARPASLGPDVDAAGLPLEVVLDPRRELRRAAAEVQYGALPYGQSQGQLEEIGIPPLHLLGYSGNRVRLMMIDTGFRKDHQAFLSSDLLNEWDFVFEDGNVQNEPGDLEFQHSHGTATWASAAGYAPGILIGPAYGASFLLAKTEDIGVEVRAEEDNYVAALEWADLQGAAVTSASLSYLCFDDDFCYELADKNGDTAVISIAIDIAASRGILCINSQGNYGCALGSLGTPADADSVIAVGAVDSVNQIATFSACGPTFDNRLKPEVVARGVRTRTASAIEVDTYGYGSGTSFSAPLVAGAAAVLLEAHPEWSPMELRAALMATADRATLPDSQYGWGRIDAALALEHAPVLYPRPFSLCAPADSEITALYTPSFAWRESTDPDQGDPLLYHLWIEDLADPQVQWSAATGDSSLTLPFALPPDRAYRWWVTADDLEGHRRFSREERVLFVQPDPSSVDGGSGSGEGGRAESGSGRFGMKLACAPNPFRAVLHFRVAVPPSAMSASNVREAGPVPEWHIYDPLGRSIAGGSAVHDNEGFGAHWDGRTDAGVPVRPGVYYLEVRLAHRVFRETIVRLPDDSSGGR